MLNYFNEEDGKSEGSDGPDGLQHLFAPGQTGTRLPYHLYSHA